MAALEAAGLKARIAAWDDESEDWSKSPLVIVRATWNYYEVPERFLRWAARVGDVCTLFNPLEVIRWNIHKGYLRDLRERGVNATPTAYVAQGSDGHLAGICDEHAWEKIVVKPAISASSFSTHAMQRDALDEALFASLVAKREMMVQPYIESVEEYGERSIVMIDGEVCHSIRKEPRLAGGDESVSGPHPIDDDVRALATAALAAVDGAALAAVDGAALGAGDRTLLYGRVDVARDQDGAPMVMELELIEPSLFFVQSPETLDRFVNVVRSKVNSVHF